eukprot:1141241-Pyramimonas_sp.AAC.1
MHSTPQRPFPVGGYTIKGGDIVQGRGVMISLKAVIVFKAGGRYGREGDNTIKGGDIILTSGKEVSPEPHL